MGEHKADVKTIDLIRRFLEESLTQVEGSEFWNYKNGLTDSEVARRLGCKAASVMNVRISLFGKMRPYNRNGSEPELPQYPTIEQVNALATRIAAVEAKLIEFGL